MMKKQLLLPLLLVAVFHHGTTGLVLRPRSDVKTDSRLAAAIRQLTADGSRFEVPRTIVICNPSVVNWPVAVVRRKRWR